MALCLIDPDHTALIGFSDRKTTGSKKDGIQIQQEAEQEELRR
jgi:hypothetical protein